MPNGVICGGAVDGSNQVGEIVTCQAMTASPAGAGWPAAGATRMRATRAATSDATSRLMAHLCLLRSGSEGIILRTTMLSARENETLTRVGRGTPMGELMRRYWQPVAAVAQLDEHPTLAVRLMGEDLVLYRDTRGRYGPLHRHCPHRRADRSNGVPE